MVSFKLCSISTWRMSYNFILTGFMVSEIRLQSKVSTVSFQPIQDSFESFDLAAQVLQELNHIEYML